MSPFPRDAYRPLTPYAPDRRPIEVDLSDNTNRWGTHPGAMAAMRAASAEDLLRYPPVYADRLREAVARRFGVPGEAVSTGCGSDDLLDSAFRAAGEPGEGVTYLPPTFSMVEIFARMNGLEPMPVVRGGTGGDRGAPGLGAPFGPLPDPNALLAGHPALVYLCRPNNPTGEVVPTSWVQELVRAAGPDGPIVLVDEAYADFMDGWEEGTERAVEGGPVGGMEQGSRSAPDGRADRDPRDPDPDALLREAPSSSRLVVLRTLSKAYGLAGLRVGFAVGAPEVIREIEKSRGPYKVSRPAEAAAVAALDDREGWVPGIVEAVRTERVRLRAELERRGLAPLPSGANFLLVPLPEPGKLGDAATATAALRDQGVAVRPFPDLPGMEPGGRPGDGIRVTIGPRAQMDRFLGALDRVMDR